jgi:hypothetical protein
MSLIEPRTSVVTLYQGDYLDQIRVLERRYDAAIDAEKNTTRTLGGIPQSEELLAEHTALVAEAEETAIHVKLKALGRRVWRDLTEAHPPREGNKGDQQIGVNDDSFKEALVPVSIVEPEFSSDDLDEISDVDFDRLYNVAFALNRAPAAGPKAIVRASQESTPSDAR